MLHGTPSRAGEVPSVNQQPPVDVYTGNDLSQHHPAFKWMNSQTQFDAQAGGHVPRGTGDLDLAGVVVGRAAPDSLRRPGAQPMAPAPRPAVPAADKLRFWESIFSKAINSLKDQHPVEPKGRTESGYSIRSLTCWDDVSAKLQEARDRYDDSAGVAGGFKKMMRKGADKAKVAQAVVSFIPEMDYVSPVLAVLKVILNAAKTTSNLRRDLASSMEELERNFGDVETYVATFPGDENIDRASVTLVAATLYAIENLIGYYIKRQATRAISAVFSGEDYQKCLVQSLEQIKTSSQELLHQARNSNMHQNKQTLDAVAQGSAYLSEVVTNQNSAAETQNRILVLLEQYNKNVMDVGRQLTAYLAAVQAQATMAVPATIAPTHHQLPVAPRPDPSYLQSIRAKIIAMLQIPESTSRDDIDHVHRTQERLPTSDRQRAGQLVTQPLFTSWMTTPSSAELLIHGDLEGQQYISGVTLFCTHFVRTLSALPPAANTAVVSFLCGRHLDPASPSAGGKGMLRCLVAQVLELCVLRHGLGVLAGMEPTLSDTVLVESGDIPQLASLFQRLVGILGQGSSHGRCQTLFCVVDGIKYYERDEFWGGGVWQVLGLLLSMARADPWQQQQQQQQGQAGQQQAQAQFGGGGGGGCIFKLLVTSPSPTRLVRGMVPEARILTMSGNVMPATGQGFSGGMFERLLGGTMAV